MTKLAIPLAALLVAAAPPARATLIGTSIAYVVEVAPPAKTATIFSLFSLQFIFDAMASDSGDLLSVNLPSFTPSFTPSAIPIATNQTPPLDVGESTPPEPALPPLLGWHGA